MSDLRGVTPSRRRCATAVSHVFTRYHITIDDLQAGSLSCYLVHLLLLCAGGAVCFVLLCCAVLWSRVVLLVLYQVVHGATSECILGVFVFALNLILVWLLARRFVHLDRPAPSLGWAEEARQDLQRSSDSHTDIEPRAG